MNTLVVVLILLAAFASMYGAARFSSSDTPHGAVGWAILWVVGALVFCGATLGLS